LDVHVIGVGKDQYNEYLDQMVESRILPWTEDSQSEFYPVWTEWEASQRDVYFLNRNGIVDTTFNITPYDPNNPEDYSYIIDLILDLRNDTWNQNCTAEDGTEGVELWSECYSIENTDSLDLSESGLTGEIPPEIGNLINLTFLELSQNQLTGAIPTEIGNLINLKWLSLWENQLTGNISESIWDLVLLENLDLEDNQLTGSIPPEIGNLTNLTGLLISYNELTEVIPPEIGNLTNLYWLTLSYNQLTGEIPPEIWNLTNLHALYLSNNQLIGSIPSEIGNLTNLERVVMNSNQLIGSIPLEIGNLTNLNRLKIHTNQLTGSIPDTICNLSNLTWSLEDSSNSVSTLYANQLCPPYPECIEEYIGDQDTANCEQGSISAYYQSGWNILGLPLEVENANYQSLFPNAQSGTLYSFDGTYQSEQYLELGTGYLLKFTSDDLVSFTGAPINELTISLSEGWNLFSGLTTSFSPGELYSEDIIQNGTIYGLDIVYYSPESIDPGMGYWIRAIQDGEITLFSNSLSIKSLEPINPLSNANTLVLSSGPYSTKLFFGMEIPQGEKFSYSLPPTFPQMAFDARFTDDMKVIAESGEIVILNQFETLTVAYDIKIESGEHMSWVLTSESGYQFVLEDTGEITIPSEDSYTLDRVSQLPKTFSLNQNFPNPFNNNTSIHYYLPVNAHVRIQIISLTGTLINTLINKSQISGFHHVEWNGMDLNANTVSSGVYIYKFSTDDHSLTRKCIFLK